MARRVSAKGRIETATLNLFAEKGVDQTSIRDIATAAGVSEGALYRHYRSKADLVHALFAENYSALAGRLETLEAEQKSLRGKLDAMIAAFCELFEADRPLFTLLLLVQHEALPRLEAEQITPVEVVRRVVSEAMDRGEIARQDPDLATAVVFGIVLQPAVFRIYGRIHAPMTELRDQLVDACWSALNSRRASDLN